MTGPASDFERDVTKAMFWSLVEKWIGRGVGLVALLFFGRLLTPADFGVLSILGVYVAAATFITDLGLSKALIQRRTVSQADMRSAFTLNLLSGFILCVTALALASPLSRLLGEPSLTGLLRGMSPVAILLGLGMVPEALMMRDLSFRRLAIRRLIATSLGVAVGVTLALRGFGAWSYVWLVLAQSAVATVAVWIAGRRRPSLGIRLASVRDLWRFARHVLGIDAVSFAGGNIDYVIVGVALGSSALGFYTVGFRILQVVADLLSAGLAAVALPAFSRIAVDKARSRRAYLTVVQVSAATAVPAFAMLALMSYALIPLIFGPGWEPSVGVMAALAVASAFSSVSYFDRGLLLAMNRGRLELALSMIALLFEVIVTVSMAPFGIFWVAVGLGAVHFLGWPLRIWSLRVAVGLDVREYLRSVLPVLGATLSMLTVGLAFLGMRQAPLALRAGFELAAIVITYLGMLRLLAPAVWTRLFELAHHILRRDRSAMDTPS